MKHYKTSEKARKVALAYYYANKEKCTAYQLEYRRAHGVQPHTPAMTREARLAAVLICKTCGGQVTAPTLLLKRQHKCTKCIKRQDRKRQREQGDAGIQQRRWRQSPTGKLKKFTAWKLAQKCSKCGYDQDPQKLHFHHRDPATKVMKVSRMLHQSSMKKIWAEVAKCDLLCKPCHEAAHAGPCY